MIRINPQQQLRKDGVSLANNAVFVSSIFRRSNAESDANPSG
jgi:hypothetical protein